MFTTFLQVQCASGPLRLVVASEKTEKAQQVAEQLPDAELVRRALDGNPTALEVLYRRHAPQVLRRATRLLARSSEAEDVVQDAFVEASPTDRNSIRCRVSGGSP